MKPALLLVFGGLLSILAVIAEAAPPDDPHSQPMPEVLYRSDPSSAKRPLFVREDKILRNDGSIDPEKFAAAEISVIKDWYLDLEPVEPCHEIYRSADHFNSPELHWDNYESIVEDSDFIVVARVTGKATGFSSVTPGTLVRLKPNQWLKGEDDWDVKYRFFPSGEVTLGNSKLCVSHGDFPETPRTGDRILIAYKNSYRNQVYPWIVGVAPRMMVLRPEGKTELPRWIRKQNPEWVGKSDFRIIEEIRKIVEGKAATVFPGWRATR